MEDDVDEEDEAETAIETPEPASGRNRNGLLIWALDPNAKHDDEEADWSCEDDDDDVDDADTNHDPDDDDDADDEDAVVPKPMVVTGFCAAALTDDLAIVCSKYHTS